MGQVLCTLQRPAWTAACGARGLSLNEGTTSPLTPQSVSRVRPTVATLVFLVLFLVGAVPLVGSVTWGRYQQQQAALTILQRDLQMLAQGVSMVGSEYLQDRRRMLTLTRLALERAPSWSPQELQQLLDEEAAATRSMSALYLLETNGTSVFSSSSLSPDRSGTARAHPQVDHSDEPYFREFKETGVIAWSGVRRGQFSGRAEVLVALPVRAESTGEKKVLVGGIDVGGLTTVFDGIKREVDLRYVVMDHLGGVVLDSDGADSAAGNFALEAVFLPTCPQSIEPIETPDGQLMYAACSQMAVGSHLWAAWVITPDLGTAVGSEAIVRFWLGLGGGLLFLGLIATAVAVRVRNYFARLNRIVAMIGDGTFEVQFPQSNAATPQELLRLRQIGAQMMHRLRQHGETTSRLVAELEEANRQLRPLAAAWAQIGEAVEILDSEGNILFANPACVDMLGDAATEPGTRSTIWEDGRSARIEECFARKRRWTGELEDIGQGGRRIQAVTVTPVFEEGRLERVVVIRWDLTDLRAAESVAAHTERLASLGTLAAGLAHEINNPLTYILMNLELLRMAMEKAEEPELKDAAQESLAGVGLIRRVVEQMLLLARGDSVTDAGETRQMVPLRRLLDSAVMIARARFRGQLQMSIQVDGEPEIWVREAELTQVVVNLVVNAGLAYANGQGSGPVDVEGGVDPDDGDVVVVRVRDAGVGMTPAELRQAFDPFFTTRAVGQGTGLGLSVARSIVDAHGGSLTAQSAKGVGSVFTVRLPSTPMPPAASLPAPPKNVSPRRLQVLVVDDDLRVAEVIARRLSSHEVTVAIGGLDALDLLEENAFDAVLSDVMMPDLDGPSLYDELSGRWPHLQERFAFVTGAPRDSTVARAVKQTGRPVFHKPVPQGLLLEWLDSLVMD